MSRWIRKIKSYAAARPWLWKMLKKVQEWKYILQYQWFYGKFSISKASINEINLEFSSSCNLRCVFCALDHNKPKSYMSLEVLNRVFNSILNDKRFSGVKQVNLYNGGETLMHPDRQRLFERIKYYQVLFYLSDRPFPRIVLLTNGMLLRPQLATDLLSLRVVNEIGFSLDGGSPQAFENLRVNARWEKFAENVRTFTRLKKEIDPSVKTFGISIVPKPHPLNDSWMHPDFREITGMLDSVEYRRLHDWGGQVDIGEKQEVNKRGCDLLMKQMVVLPNGDVTVCCNDLNAKGVVGNVLEHELYDIYHGEDRLNYVKLLYQGRKEELELCRECVSF